ncbi:MAG: zinc-finger domain-containing protein [Beijerinckiaceae bacterium]
MASHTIPHLHNDDGAQVIHVGAKEFMCIGAKPPFDHPHIYLDIGSDTEIICPYCSTLYRFRSDLHADQTDPKGCILMDDATSKVA